MNPFTPEEIDVIIMTKKYVYHVCEQHFSPMMKIEFNRGNIVVSGIFLQRQLEEFKNNGYRSQWGDIDVFFLDSGNDSIWGEHRRYSGKIISWKEYTDLHSKIGSKPYMEWSEYHNYDARKYHWPGIKMDMRWSRGRDSRITGISISLVPSKTREELIKMGFKRTSPGLYCSDGRLYITRNAYDFKPKV